MMLVNSKEKLNWGEWEFRPCERCSYRQCCIYDKNTGFKYTPVSKDGYFKRFCASYNLQKWIYASCTKQQNNICATCELKLTENFDKMKSQQNGRAENKR